VLGGLSFARVPVGGPHAAGFDGCASPRRGSTCKFKKGADRETINLFVSSDMFTRSRNSTKQGHTDQLEIGDNRLHEFFSMEIFVKGLQFFLLLFHLPLHLDDADFLPHDVSAQLLTIAFSFEGK